MAVEDELRVGPVIEPPKTRIFADQVCETASSLVESVRWPVLSSPPLHLSLFFSATVMISSAVCVCVVPLTPSLCLGLTCLPLYTWELWRWKGFDFFLHSSAHSYRVCCGHIQVFAVRCFWRACPGQNSFDLFHTQCGSAHTLFTLCLTVAAWRCCSVFRRCSFFHAFHFVLSTFPLSYPVQSFPPSGMKYSVLMQAHTCIRYRCICIWGNESEGM